MKYIFIALILTSCVVCPTTKQIDKWKSKGCLTFDTTTNHVYKHDTIVLPDFTTDTIYQKDLDTLVQKLYIPYVKQSSGKKLINNFIKKEEPIICSFTKTVDINNCTVFLTFDGINLSTKVKYKQTNITINKTNIWTYWYELIWIIIVSILIGAVLALFIKK